MTRRLLLALPLAACLRADAEKEAEDLIRSVADALSAGKVELFLSFFDRAMPDFDKLRVNVTGLLAAADVSCNIEVRANGGDDTDRALTLDWILTLEANDGAPGATQREKTVKCQLKKSAKNWRIVSFEPLDLFVPPAA
jgi:hypothetical protein